eukprot:scaffold9782_cov150-Amphora_coffeaeformis.AAC.8
MAFPPTRCTVGGLILLLLLQASCWKLVLAKKPTDPIGNNNNIDGTSQATASDQTQKLQTRRVLFGQPPSTTIKRFSASTPPTQFSPRVNIDSTIPSLPVGDGPGVLPGFPQATPEFWLASGAQPKQVWESVACPVLDPNAFLEDPLRCFFGEASSGGLEQYFQGAISEQVVGDFTTGIAVPIVVEALILSSGVPVIELRIIPL